MGKSWSEWVRIMTSSKEFTVRKGSGWVTQLERIDKISTRISTKMCGVKGWEFAKTETSGNCHLAMVTADDDDLFILDILQLKAQD